MILVFTLSMPRNNSWNGKWSGQNRGYYIVKNVGVAQKTLARLQPIIGESFWYDFGDGWAASVSVEEVDSKKAAGFRKASAGFCGYNWMVDEILSLGRIRTLAERYPPKPKVEAQAIQV